MELIFLLIFRRTKLLYMTSFKLDALLFFAIVLSLSFSKCDNDYRLDDEPPIRLGNVYYQEWRSTMNDTSSMMTLFIPVQSNNNQLVLDSVCFKNNRAQLQYVNDSLWVAYFKIQNRLKKDLVMSHEPFAEYGNKPPIYLNKWPFQIENNACVVSYQKEDHIKYFKISNIKKVVFNLPD